MAAKLGTFDFRKLNVIFGVSQITGFAEGDALKVEEKNPAFNVAGGADGHIDRVKNNANYLEITMSLRQTSPTNQILSAIHLADRAGGGPVPIFIKDKNGTTLFTCAKAWIEKFPSGAFGNEAKTRDWVIHTSSDYVINYGGND
jgi:hypothetical protein